MRTYFSNSLVLFILTGIFFSTNTFAQNTGQKYSVSYVVNENTPNILLQKAKNHIEKQLNSQGWINNNEEGYLFLIGISNPTKNEEVSLSLAVFNKIDKEIVELGKREQVFYLALENEKSNPPSESIDVREYMSEEYMKQFSMILDNYTVITSVPEISATLNTLLKTFSLKFSK